MISARAIAASEIAEMRRMLALLGRAFGDEPTYLDNQPSDDYLRTLLSGETFIAIGGYVDGTLAGGLAGYVLPKFEQPRSEFYIYDLAVDEAHRRRGVATAMIQALRAIARRRNIYVIYVQADLVDEPAIALYAKVGVREDVLHFDIDPGSGPENE